MSLLGIDVGTTGCKAVAFSESGRMLAMAYEEYDAQRPETGWAELDAAEIWGKIKSVIARVARQTASDSIESLAVSSLGEALVPVTKDRRILGPSLLSFDSRGAEFLPDLAARLENRRLYQINGNTLGNNYSLPKLKWIQHHQPDLYEQVDLFLPWGSFVAFMLGGQAVVDPSLANRTLLLDVEQNDWSETLLRWAGLDKKKLPAVLPAGQPIGTVDSALANELGLPPVVSIVNGTHDQCANAIGCGAIEDGQAVCGMGTYLCITPVFSQRRQPQVMIERGLNTEAHAVPGKYVCFIYNQGGALLKWYRDTFAACDHQRWRSQQLDTYEQLMAELSPEPSPVLVLPHFVQTGPPQFIDNSCGVITGLHLDTTRAQILKGILQSAMFYLRESVEALSPTGIRIEEFRATGGGSKSDAWLQLSADIFQRPFARSKVQEAGALGAAILAGLGSARLSSISEGVEAMTGVERVFSPASTQYNRLYQKYCKLWPTMKNFLSEAQ